MKNLINRIKYGKKISPIFKSEYKWSPEVKVEIFFYYTTKGILFDDKEIEYFISYSNFFKTNYNNTNIIATGKDFFVTHILGIIDNVEEFSLKNPIGNPKKLLQVI